MSNISLADRKNFIGASEVADLFGIGFKSKWQLWLEKTGRIEPEDLSANENVQAGKFLEPAIAEWAAEKWGMNLRKVRRYIKHPAIPRFGASLDYESMEGALVPVEIKWSQSNQGWEFEGDQLLDCPLRYLLQIQAQMCCTAADHAWLIVLLSGKLKRMRIERHYETIIRIIKEVEEFWRSVDTNEEPKPDFAYDGAMIAQLMSVTKDAVVDLTSNNHLPMLCAEYQAACSVVKDGDARKEAALAEIRSILTEAGGPGTVLTNGFKITNSQVPEMPVQYVRKGYLITRITQVKEKV